MKWRLHAERPSLPPPDMAQESRLVLLLEATREGAGAGAPVTMAVPQEMCNRFNVPLLRHARGPMTSGTGDSPPSLLPLGIAPPYLTVVTTRVSIMGTGEDSAVRMTGAWVDPVAPDTFHVAACLEHLRWTAAFLLVGHLGAPAFLKGIRSGAAARMGKGNFEAVSMSRLAVSRDLRGVHTAGSTHGEREGFTEIALSSGVQEAGGGHFLVGDSRDLTEAAWDLGVRVLGAQ